jgi:uncharacterized protein YqjF (DUF2071 family)
VPPIIRQLWRDVAFVHWRFDVASVQTALPRGLVVDIYDDAAWVSIVCFSTTCQLGGFLPLPGPRRYPETNVRTYVRAPDGSTGLYFFSLDVTNRANVASGRACALRYRLADMQVDAGAVWRYCGVRRGDPTASYDIAVEPHPEPADGELDIFLTARWSAYAPFGGHLTRVDVQHQPWPLRRADVTTLEQTILAAERLPSPTGQAFAHVASGVDANLAPRNLMW